MPQQLIAIDADALSTLIEEVKGLRSELRAAKLQPEPKWLTVQEYAARVGKSESTINRWIASGTIEAKTEGRSRMVRL